MADLPEQAPKFPGHRLSLHAGATGALAVDCPRQEKRVSLEECMHCDAWVGVFPDRRAGGASLVCDDPGEPASERLDPPASPAVAAQPCSEPRAARVRDRFVLFVVQGTALGSVFSIPAQGAVLGRSLTASVVLDGEAIAPRHAEFSVRGEAVFVEDLSGEPGTFVNEQRVEQRVRLCDGDYVRIGKSTVVKFSLVDAAEEHALCTLFELTLRDPLTRLYNRRYFDDRVRSEFSFAQRHRTPLGLLLVDIDHFKAVNDTFGHLIGDRVLQLVARNISKMMRPEDVLARYGGEEFIIVCRDSSLRNAQILGERVRRSIEAMRLDRLGPALQVSVSIGVAAIDAEHSCASAEALIQAADRAMYAAKSAGRNRVATASA
jgi:diguanylate cyclase (GGDEF)-like protein